MGRRVYGVGKKIAIFGQVMRGIDTARKVQRQAKECWDFQRGRRSEDGDSVRRGDGWDRTA